MYKLRLYALENVRLSLEIVEDGLKAPDFSHVVASDFHFARCDADVHRLRRQK